METNEFETDLGTQSGFEPKGKKGGVLAAILGGLLLISAGFNIYQFTQNKKTDQELQLVNVDLSDTKAAKEQLQKEFDNISADYTLAKTEISVKDSLLSQRDTEIAEKQQQIQKILNKSNASQAELAKAQKLINSLNNDINLYKEQIATLTAANDSLKVANDTLLVRGEKLSSNLATQTKKADDTESLMRSTFSVSNYKITGLKVKGSGKEVESDKAKRIDKLRVTFDLDANQHAASGQKEIYIAIFKPDGKLGIFKDATPGQLETWSNGTIDYSDKVSFNYQQGSKQNITFDWEEYEFPQGTYKIDLYQNGMKIGQKSLELR